MLNVHINTTSCLLIKYIILYVKDVYIMTEKGFFLHDIFVISLKFVTILYLVSHQYLFLACRNRHHSLHLTS